MGINVLKEIIRALEGGRGAALAAVIESGGSSPAKPGALMAVFEDGGICGTVGGGAAEGDIIGRCAEAIRDGKGFLFEYDLSPAGEPGGACGGWIKGSVQVFPARKRLLIFGGGHIAQRLAPLADGLGFDVAVADDRDEFKSRFEGARYIACRPGDIAKHYAIGPDTFIVIVTRGHAADLEALITVAGSDAAYIGMVGSAAKTGEVFASAAAAGVPARALSAVYAPIGLDIADNSPGEIAVSIISEILLIKNGRRLGHMRDNQKDNQIKYTGNGGRDV